MPTSCSASSCLIGGGRRTSRMDGPMRGRYAVRILNVTQCFRVDKLGLALDLELSNANPPCRSYLFPLLELKRSACSLQRGRTALYEAANVLLSRITRFSKLKR